jgi:hypothetical protein
MFQPEIQAARIYRNQVMKTANPQMPRDIWNLRDLATNSHDAI